MSKTPVKITREDLPSRLSNLLNDKQLADVNNQIDAVSRSPEEREAIVDSFISYPKVLEGSSYTVGSYLKAIMFISFVSSGSSLVEAYKLVFPDRVARVLENGGSMKTVQTYASAFNATKLVSQIKAQLAIPFYILNQHTRQNALNKLVSLLEAKSDFIQMKSAEAILNSLQTPKEFEINLNQTTQLSDSAAELKALLQNVAAKNMADAANGASKDKLLAPLKS